jgi:hypothetical protein
MFPHQNPVYPSSFPHTRYTPAKCPYPDYAYLSFPFLCQFGKTVKL